MQKTIIFLFLILSCFAQTLSSSQFQQVQSLSQSQVQELVKQAQSNQAVSPVQTTEEIVAPENTELSIVEQDVANSQIPDEIKKKQNNFFGENFFKNYKLKPNTYGPVPDSYILGTGDEIKTVLYGEVQLSESYLVDREGAITPLDIGRLNIAGMLWKDVKVLIRKAYAKYHRSIDKGKTFVHTTIGKQRRVQVSVLGAVNYPTNMNLSALNTVFDAIVMAGGPTRNAAIRSVQIIRGSEIINYDLYNNIVPALNRPSQFRLENGDIIVLNTNKKSVRIFGAVRSPNEYEIGNGSTVDEIIKIAGGLRYTASIEYTSISTIKGEEEIVLNFNSNEELKAYQLQDGDRISVKERNIVDSSYVEIKGAVLYPGRYAYIDGMTTESLISRAGGFLKTTFRGRYDIQRKLNRKEYRAFTISHSQIDSTKLIVGDILTVYDKLSFVEEREVRIFSYAQGYFSFPYDKESDVYDYISKIGGIKYTEDDSFVEIVRLTGDKSENNYARLFKKFLNKDYLNYDATRSNEFPMEPDDIIIIRKNPNIENYQTVKILGEVTSAGTYPLIKRNSRISDLIDRAQGFKSTAYLEGVKFLRKLNDSINVRIPIDLKEIVEDEESEDNIFLADGDELIIPKNPYIVMVQGAVVSPTAVVYIEGASVEYYIEQAGGIAEKGDDARVQVIKANGKHYSNSIFSRDEITPGSVISVPFKDRVDENSTKEILQTVVTYISSIVTSLILLKQIGN